MPDTVGLGDQLQTVVDDYLPGAIDTVSLSGSLPRLDIGNAIGNVLLPDDKTILDDLLSRLQTVGPIPCLLFDVRNRVPDGLRGRPFPLPAAVVAILFRLADGRPWRCRRR